MAAIVPSRLPLFLLLIAGTVSAQQSVAVRQQVGNVAMALTDRRVELAMDSIDKSFEGYAELRTYFEALVSAYNVINEIDITDEQIANHEATLTVHWTLTLTQIEGQGSESREEDLTVKLSMKKHDWRIVDISPIEFFNPVRAKSK